MRVIGIIMILVGIYGIFDHVSAAKSGQLESFRADGDFIGRKIKRGDPDFNREIGYGIVGNTLLAGFGVLFLLVKNDEDDEAER